MTSATITIKQQRIAVFPAIFLMLLMGLFSQASFAITAVIEEGLWQNAESTTVEQGRRVYDRRSRQYYTYNTVTNSGADLQGPLRLVVTSNSHPVTNADGKDSEGHPYFNALANGDTLTDAQSLEPIRINFKRIRASFAYTTVVQKLAPDTDSDGIPDASDECPLDANNDIDGDGICGDVDFCPDHAENECISITGQVNGAGAALKGATIKINSNLEDLSDEEGKFTANVGSADDFASDNINSFFPVEVKAKGFATGHGKIIFVSGTEDYDFFIDLEPVSTTITDEDDITTGVNINKEGMKVGELTIPTGSLPEGVTEITGEVTYLDPTTDDLQATPGGDLLALPEGSNPNDTPTPLESFGMMEFNLVDQNGNEIHELAGSAEVCMQATPGLNAGDTVPLWWFNTENGLWEEEGLGTVVNKDSQLMICGAVSHFTWWNYDRPVEQHSCFKYHMVGDKNNPLSSSLTNSLDWYADAVTYNGTSPERATDRDGNDPETPLANNKIDSLTVKRSVGTTEQNRVYTIIAGTKYYLKRDGDDAYSLIASRDKGSIFNDPTESGSGIRNQNVENCQFLDYQDSNSDGIIELNINNINLPPQISHFNVLPENLGEGATADVSALVTDPNGDNITTVTWNVACYGSVVGSNDESISPDGTSGSTFNAILRAPSSLESHTENCQITLLAEDEHGATASAERWVTVISDNFAIIVEGILYGTDGLPMASHQVHLNDFDYGRECDDQDSSTVTDSTGHYRFEFDGQTCSNIYSSFDGIFSVNYDYEGAGASQSLSWNHQTRMGLYNYGGFDEEEEEAAESAGNSCSFENGVTSCQWDIHLPVLWGPMSGDIYQPEDNAKTEFTIRHGDRYRDGNEAVLTVDASATSYGPIYIPVGEGYIDTWSRGWWSQRSYLLANSLGMVRDFGEVSGNIIATVFDDSGARLEGIKTRITDSENTHVEGNSNADGEFSSVSPSGTVQASAWINPLSYWPDTYVSGYITTQGQQLYLDLNSQQTCRVTVMVYDQYGQPQENAKVWLSNSAFNQSLDKDTGADGSITVDGILPGNLRLWNDNSSISHKIDNCRSDTAGNRELNFDLPFVQPQYYGGGDQ